MSTHLSEVARLPFASDNVAVATHDLSVGLQITTSSGLIKLSHHVLEGHRFAIEGIEEGEPLLSWGMPFGKATKQIAPGDYVCNEGVLDALSKRNMPFKLPEMSNFSDEIDAFEFDPRHFMHADQVPIQPAEYTFEGYPRGAQRGVGTRNYILLIGVSSRVAGFVRHLEKELAFLSDQYQHIDGIVGIVHTEGDDINLNNRELVLRTLAGFIVHPNTGAALLIDEGSEAIQNKHVQHFIVQNSYPIDTVKCEALSIGEHFKESIEKGIGLVHEWLFSVNSALRSPQPISKLKIALQCGGSDAFSGISGNPLAGWVAHEIIKQGGSANLAETDELVGAEAYILKKVKSRSVAERFLATIDRFIHRAARHGSSAAGNPSGGNKYRGLYNIYLKSLGAAMKKHPSVRLDQVIDYGERMEAPGYYFMDSPGNDLESVAGQVAAGCNMIYFVTGNGSITNFPFVPTVKIVTTTRRFELLKDDMDVNAGAYLDGTPMEDLGRNTLQLTLDIASGKKSVGEKAGHSQVQIWRNWRQSEGKRSTHPGGDAVEIAMLSGTPVKITEGNPHSKYSIPGFQTAMGVAFAKIGLIMPTSLCAGQVARMAASHLNNQPTTVNKGLDRFIALVHTEGCGASSGSSEDLYMRTMVGHLTHPSVHKAMLLEHGCEKTHNDYFQHYMLKNNINAEVFGKASIQLGGGIQNTIEAITSWFGKPMSLPVQEKQVGLETIKLGILLDPHGGGLLLQCARLLAHEVSASGGTVIIPQWCGTERLIIEELGGSDSSATLAYAQQPLLAGVHIMEMPTQNWQEIVTGLGASGAHIMVYLGDNTTTAGHPFIPLLQFSGKKDNGDLYWSEEELNNGGGNVLKLVIDTLCEMYTPLRKELGNLDFQITRGLYGVSL